MEKNLKQFALKVFFCFFKEKKKKEKREGLKIPGFRAVGVEIAKD